MKFQSTVPSLVILITVALSGILKAQAPPRITLPDGESVVRTTIVRAGGAAPVTRRYMATAHSVYTSSYNPVAGTWSVALRQDAVQVPGFRSIVDCGVVYGDFIVVAEDGTVYRYPVRQSDGQLQAPLSITTTGAVPGETYRKLIPGGPHLLTNKRVLSSQDTGRTWSANIAGLNNATANDAGVTATGTTYLATSTGLYTQTAQGSTWQPVATAPSGNYQAVFIDRAQRIHAAAGAMAYMSANGGGVWTIDTMGLNGHSIQGFGDNAQGDIYAHAATPADALFRLPGGTGTWERIGQTITTPSYGANAQVIFNNITADSVVLLSTLFGSFSSGDRGLTWALANSGVQAEAVYGFTKTRDGQMSVSTRLGVFTKPAGATVWAHVYPGAGYLGGQPLVRDTGSVLYTFGARTILGNTGTVRQIMKSSDGGTTWQADTSGWTGLPDGKFTIDVFNIQHLTPYTPNGGPLHYSKLVNGVWQADTVGIATRSKQERISALGFNRGGLLFICTIDSGTGIIWRKPGVAPKWQKDDTSHFGGWELTIIQPYTGGGGLVAGTTDSGLVRRVQANWTLVKGPAPEYSAMRCHAVTVDTTAVAYVGYSISDGSGGFIPRGVYYTTNFGTSWTNVHLDSVHTTQLISVNDTTYALTGNGLYVLTHPKAGVEHQRSVGTGYAEAGIQVWAYQTETGHIAITLTTGTSRETTLQVTDATGRRMGEAVHSVSYPGSQTQLMYNPGQIPGGLYFIYATDGRNSSTAPLIWVR